MFSQKLRDDYQKAKNILQMGDVARILGRNHICRSQNLQRAQGDVTQISYRGGNYI